jgi:hypothetical protein
MAVLDDGAEDVSEAESRPPRRRNGFLRPIMLAAVVAGLFVGLVVAGTDIAWHNLVIVNAAGSSAPAATPAPGPDRVTVNTVVSGMRKLDATHSAASRCADEAGDAVLIRLETLTQGGDPAVSLGYYWQALNSTESDAKVLRASKLIAQPYNISIFAGDINLPGELTALTQGRGVLPAIQKACQAKVG